MKKLFIYDTTLRDGSQGEGISFSVEDKIRLIHVMDQLGADYIEAGNPGSNPKDRSLFERIGTLSLRHAKIAAFGSTCKPKARPEEDEGLRRLAEAGTSVVTVFGKAWDLHVTQVLRTSLKENLRMIHDSIRYLKQAGREVIFDAEHFFDGYKNNPAYALRAIRTAREAGADTVVLCDTNGAAFPDEITAAVKESATVLEGAKIGIHCHNDMDLATANSIAAVLAGAVHLQGTLNGFGERCGNANLCILIPNLQLKRGYDCIPPEQMRTLKAQARYVFELANLAPDEQMPYIGNNAFAHKGGMHIDAVQKNPVTFEHIDPAAVGNRRRLLLSEMSGRSSVISAIRKVDDSIVRDSKETGEILSEIKNLELEGYQFEGAEGSFALLVRKKLGKYKPFFTLDQFQVVTHAPKDAPCVSTASIKITSGGVSEITAAEGDGPVNALDKALRKALGRFYPALSKMRLVDFKVRILDGNDAATASLTRVLIDSTDGTETWTTIGVSRDIVQASWKALVDSVEYMLEKEENRQEE
ncbi:MAG: citramalate synthase [Clostridia bacterium]